MFMYVFSYYPWLESFIQVNGFFLKEYTRANINQGDSLWLVSVQSDSKMFY